MWSGRSRSCCASAWIFFLAFFKVISRDSRPTPELKAPANRVSVQRCPKVSSWFRATVLTVDTPPKLLPPPPFRSAETKVPIAELPPCAFSSNYGETTSVGLLKSLDLMVKYLDIWHNDSWLQNSTTGCANGICPVGGDFFCKFNFRKFGNCQQPFWLIPVLHMVLVSNVYCTPPIRKWISLT